MSLESNTKRKRPDDERELIAKAHVLLKKVNSTSAAAADAALASLGGLAAYQAASLGGESACGGVDSSDWVKEELSNRKQPASSSTTGSSSSTSSANADARLLDVGAIVARYEEEYNATHIDLTSNDPQVQKIDFFDFAKKTQADNVYFTTVVLSLVVNFVGSARARGDMLQKASELLRPQGLLFFVLPSACVDNSRYLDQSLLLEILKVCGFEDLDVSRSNNGRLWRCIGRKHGDDSPAFDVASFQKKRVLRGGPDRNNFTIQFSSVNVNVNDPVAVVAGTCSKKALSKRPGADVLSSNQRKRLRQQKMKESRNKVELL
jgi:25S rRNA (adenine2142-N1)-methyltransferase